MNQKLQSSIEDIAHGWLDVATDIMESLRMGCILTHPEYKSVISDMLISTREAQMLVDSNDKDLTHLYAQLIENINLMLELEREQVVLIADYFGFMLPLTETEVKALARETNSLNNFSFP